MSDITSIKDRTVKIVDDDTAEITVVYVVKKSELEAEKSAIESQELPDKEKRKIARIDEQLKMFDVSIIK